jgi:hypothetical protein
MLPFISTHTLRVTRFSFLLSRIKVDMPVYRMVSGSWFCWRESTL